MQTLEGLKKRIKTTSSLKDIVSSMKTLSAVSVGQYEKSTRALQNYSDIIEKALQAVLRDTNIPDLKKNSKHQKVIAVLIGSDQGLVGKFNKMIVNYAFDYFKKNEISKEDVSLIVAGKSLSSKVLAEGWNVNTLFSMPSSVKMMISVAKKIILRLTELHVEGKDEDDAYLNFSKGDLKVLLFFNRKVSSTAFDQDMVQLLPVDTEFLKKIKKRKWDDNQIPMYNFDEAGLFSSFIRQLLFVNVYKAISQSLSAEHFTRMMTMQNAEKNIDEHLDQMNLEYQQRRQTEITDELLDVVTGAEVLKNKKKVNVDSFVILR